MTRRARLSPEVASRLEMVSDHAEKLVIFEEQLMAQLDELIATVSRNTSVTKSAIDLIVGLHDKVKACNYDPAAIDAVLADLKESTDSLAAAVTSNTPAETPAATQPETAPAVEPEVLPPDQGPAEPSQ